MKDGNGHETRGMNLPRASELNHTRGDGPAECPMCGGKSRKIDGEAVLCRQCCEYKEHCADTRALYGGPEL